MQKKPKQWVIVCVPW